MATTDTDEARELVERAMKLPPPIRERIARELFESVGGSPPNTDADWAYWKAEIARRIEAVENGTSKTYTLEEAMARIRKDREGRGS